MRTNTPETDTETIKSSTPGPTDSGRITQSLGAAQYFFNSSCALVAVGNTTNHLSSFNSNLEKYNAAKKSAEENFVKFRDARTDQDDAGIVSLTEDYANLDQAIRDASNEKTRNLAKVCRTASLYYLTGQSSHLIGLSKEDVDYIRGVYNSLLASQTNDPLRMSVMLSASARTSAAGNFGECLLLSAVCAALGEKSLASHLMPAAFENFSNAAQKYWESEKAAPLAVR